MNENNVNVNAPEIDASMFNVVGNDAVASEKIIAPRYSYWKSVFRVFFKHKGNILLLFMLFVMITSSIFVPMIAKYDPFENVTKSVSFNMSPRKALDSWKNPTIMKDGKEIENMEEAYTEALGVMINSGEWNGMESAELYCTADLNGVFPRTERHSRLIDIAVKTNAYQHNGHPFFEYHLTEDMQYGFQGLAPVTITAENNPDLQSIEQPILLDMLTGKIHRILSWNAGNGHCHYIFQNLPLTDYPLVICDEKALPCIPTR
jgi:hypothetical protein